MEGSKYFLSDTLRADIMIVIASFVAGIWSIDMQYLEDEGITWIQLFAIGDTTTVVYGWLFWFAFMSFEYYHSNSETYLSFVLSILPRFETSRSKCYLNKAWSRLIGRGFTLGFDGQFYMAALLYCDSGDAMMLRMTFNSFLGAVVSIIFFKEAFTLWMGLAFILAIIGLILICQPSFIFDSGNGDDDSDSISWFAILLVLLSSLSRTIDKTLVKMSHVNDGSIIDDDIISTVDTVDAVDTVDILDSVDTDDNDERVHWLPMIVIPYCITSLIAWTELTLFVLYKYYVNENITLWYDMNNNSLNNIALAGIWLFGAIVILNGILNTVAYQIGDIGRLGIIGNSDVIATYLMQIWLLNTVENYLVYIGAVVILIGTVILFVEQIRISMENNGKEGEEFNYQALDDSESGNHH